MGDEHFVECFVMVLLGIHIECLGFVGRNGDFFEFVVDMFLDAAVVTDVGMNIEKIPNGIDFHNAK